MTLQNSIRMNAGRVLMCLVVISTLGVSRTVVPSSEACEKNVSFAVAESGQPVPAIPKFVAKWIGKAKHIEGYPEFCLSQLPSSKTANYVVILSTTESSFDGLTPSAHTYTSTGPLSGNAAGVSSYGGTWSYSYTGALPAVSTSSIDLQRVDASKKVLVLRAYSQQGREVSHYKVDAKHTREELLELVTADIHRDVVETPSRKPMAAPLSVYYVNCDVDSPTPASLTPSTEPPVRLPEPKPPLPSPQDTLDFWSSPAGADVYLDGGYKGKTPLTTSIAPGEHLVVMRKQDFGTWQRKIQITVGSRKVTAFLERRVLNLPIGQQ